MFEILFLWIKLDVVSLWQLTDMLRKGQKMTSENIFLRHIFIAWMLLVKVQNSLNCFFSEWRLGNRFPNNHLRGSHLFLHVFAFWNDQTLDCEMDHVHLHALLLDLRGRPVLPRVLHPHSDGRCPRPGRGTYVECKMQIFNPSKKEY